MFEIRTLLVSELTAQLCFLLTNRRLQSRISGQFKITCGSWTPTLWLSGKRARNLDGSVDMVTLLLWLMLTIGIYYKRLRRNRSVARHLIPSEKPVCENLGLEPRVPLLWRTVSVLLMQMQTQLLPMPLCNRSA